jgi:hypothetical protein
MEQYDGKTGDDLPSPGRQGREDDDEGGRGKRRSTRPDWSDDHDYIQNKKRKPKLNKATKCIPGTNIQYNHAVADAYHSFFLQNPKATLKKVVNTQIVDIVRKSHPSAWPETERKEASKLVKT